MKRLVQAHYYLQWFCCLLAAVVAATLLINIGFVYILACLQLIVGAMQLGTALIGFCARTWRTRAGNYHLLGTLAYFFLFALGFALEDVINWPEELIFAYFFGPPWVLAVLYWYHSRCLFLGAKATVTSKST